MNQAAKERYGFDGSEVYAEICYRVFDEYLRDEAFIREEYDKFSKMLAQQGVTSIKEIGFDRYSGFTSVLKDLENKDELIHRVNLVSQPVGAPTGLRICRVLPGYTRWRVYTVHGIQCHGRRRDPIK